jgi:hypothetical protein
MEQCFAIFASSSSSGVLLNVLSYQCLKPEQIGHNNIAPAIYRAM